MTTPHPRFNPHPHSPPDRPPGALYPRIHDRPERQRGGAALRLCAWQLPGARGGAAARHAHPGTGDRRTGGIVRAAGRDGGAGIGGRARAAFFDPLCLIDANGDPVPLHELGPEVKAALVISYPTRGGVPALFVRHVNRNPALTALERQLAHLEAQKRERAEAQRQEPEALRAARGRCGWCRHSSSGGGRSRCRWGARWKAGQGVEVEPPVQLRRWRWWPSQRGSSRCGSSRPGRCCGNGRMRR